MDSDFDSYNNTVQSIDDSRFNALVGKVQGMAGNRLSSSLFFVRLVTPRDDDAAASRVLFDL
jgi:hypothetical protein